MRKIHYKFTIPVTPDSINKVTKYGKTDGDVLHLKKKWEKIAIMQLQHEINEGRLPKEFKGVIGLHFKLYFEFSRTRDDDNYTLMCKGILDAFVRVGLIEDDSNEFVKDNGRRLIVDPDHPRVDVYITEHIADEAIPDLKYLLPAQKIDYGIPKSITTTTTENSDGNNKRARQ